MAYFDKATNEYMASRGVRDTAKLEPEYGSGAALGLKDLRSRLGIYTIVFLIFICIVFAVILGASAALFGKINSDDKGKEFKNNNSDWVNGTSWVTIVLSASFLILSALYIGYNYNRFEKEDAVLSDMARLGLEPLEQKEIHNGLTDLIANRTGLSKFQRAQLRQNIGNTVTVDNAQLYQNYLTSPSNLKIVSDRYEEEARKRGLAADQAAVAAQKEINDLTEKLLQTSRLREELEKNNKNLKEQLTEATKTGG